jgi:hypothetical protein
LLRRVSPGFGCVGSRGSSVGVCRPADSAFGGAADASSRLVSQRKRRSRRYARMAVTQLVPLFDVTTRWVPAARCAFFSAAPEAYRADRSYLEGSGCEGTGIPGAQGCTPTSADGLLALDPGKAARWECAKLA